MIFYKIKDKRTGAFVKKPGARMYQTVTRFDDSYTWDNLKEIQKSISYFYTRAKKNIQAYKSKLTRSEARLKQQSSTPHWHRTNIKIFTKKIDEYTKGAEDFGKYFEIVKYERVWKELIQISSLMENKIEPGMLLTKQPSKEDDIIDGV